MKKGIYLYGITDKIEKKNFGPIGINEAKVEVIPCKDINALISETPIINFDRFDKEKLTKYVTIHQKVNEEVMRNYDVVPMAFGIIAPSKAEVLRILERAYLQFKTVLRKIAGKAEFAVQVWWNQEKLLEELVNVNPEIERLKQKAFSKVSILGMPIKLKLGKLIQQEIEAQKEAFIQDIQAHLKNSSHDFTSNKLIEDDMLANFSFLIEKAREGELDKKMQELGKKYEEKLRFKYIGPMPAYSFVNINLELGNFEVVDEARELLSLGEEATLEGIKKAYYSLAHQCHPDKHLNDPEKVQEMKKINQAYSILENYCQSYDDSCGDFMEEPYQKYSFKEEAVKNSLIIK
ncbi:GvpL/GvpF family gas vesicle protein [Patescibacteria group bacterium]|nr:GvpL/GvpF family gas vesicle protein [Patescibacteria group bacterium]